MDVQTAAIGKAVLAGDLRLFVDARITTEFFPDERNARVYRFLLDHWTRYGVPPNEEVVKQSFPLFDLTNDEQPTQYIIDQLRERREAVMQMAALQEASAVIADADEPDKVARVRTILHSHLISAQLETSGTQDIDFVSSYGSITQRLGLRRQIPGYLRGYPTGFHGIDYVTGGLQPEQFVVVTGIPKSGKSSFLLYMALALHQHGKRPMFIGFEMSNTEQEDRLVSLLAKVSLTKILNGTTDTDEYKAILNVRRLIQDMPEFLFSSDIASAMTVQGIQAKAQKYQPDAIFIDGLYLMSSGDEKNLPRGTPQALTAISRDTKKLAQSGRIPIVGTTQSLVSRSKGGLTLASLGYTSAWGQDADVLLGVERQQDSNVSRFHVMESRSGPRADTLIEWDWDKGYVGELDPALYTPAAKAAARKEFDD